VVLVVDERIRKAASLCDHCDCPAFRDKQIEPVIQLAKNFIAPHPRNIGIGLMRLFALLHSR